MAKSKMLQFSNLWTVKIPMALQTIYAIIHNYFKLPESGPEVLGKNRMDVPQVINSMRPASCACWRGLRYTDTTVIKTRNQFNPSIMSSQYCFNRCLCCSPDGEIYSCSRSNGWGRVSTSASWYEWRDIRQMLHSFVEFFKYHWVTYLAPSTQWWNLENRLVVPVRLINVPYTAILRHRLETSFALQSTVTHNQTYLMSFKTKVGRWSISFKSKSSSIIPDQNLKELPGCRIEWLSCLSPPVRTS